MKTKITFVGKDHQTRSLYRENLYVNFPVGIDDAERIVKSHCDRCIDASFVKIEEIAPYNGAYPFLSSVYYGTEKIWDDYFKAYFNHDIWDCGK